MKEPFLKAKYFMGSMTNIANRPFRRLVTELGADATIGEMAIASYVVKGGSQDAALLRRDPSERIFGAQIVGNNPNHLAKAAKYAQKCGADFVDFNCACPHESVVSHGGGALLLNQPEKIHVHFEAIRAAVTIPVSVKLRKGFGADDNTAEQIAETAQACGIDAIFIHGRTKAAQYRGPADWDLVERIARNVDIPVIGCGDLAHVEAVKAREASSACAGFALARGAVIPPWIFRELAQGAGLDYSGAERLALFSKLVEYTLEAFGRDARGYDKSKKFLLKQLEFLMRYVPAAAYGRECELQERAEEWTPRDEIEALWASSEREARLEILRLAGFPDAPEAKTVARDGVAAQSNGAGTPDTQGSDLQSNGAGAPDTRIDGA